MITKLKRRPHFVNLERLNKDSIIIDAGACFGDFIMDLRDHEQTKQSLIYAIEPSKENVKKLRNLKDPNLTIFQGALAGNEDKLIFHSSRKPGWGTTQRHPPALANSYRVKTVKINDIFLKFLIPRIDYMKMVIGGDEKRVLDAMTQKTAKKIKQITVEFHKQYGTTKDYIKEMLEKFGFEIKAEHYKEVFGERE